jgi:hypothetical protein
MSNIEITLPDGSKQSVVAGTSPIDIARSISDQAVAAIVAGAAQHADGPGRPAAGDLEHHGMGGILHQHRAGGAAGNRCAIRLHHLGLRIRCRRHLLHLFLRNHLFVKQLLIANGLLLRVVRLRGIALQIRFSQALLREVMNTVGKADQLGGGIRCVVSVSMLTEGWDANTVTHILGIRAFGTQLLCEQVVGRGLRRMSYTSRGDE